MKLFSKLNEKIIPCSILLRYTIKIRIFLNNTDYLILINISMIIFLFFQIDKHEPDVKNFNHFRILIPNFISNQFPPQIRTIRPPWL